MIFKTKAEALRSLREFTPFMRKAHKVVRFWSNQDNDWRWTRVLR